MKDKRKAGMDNLIQQPPLKKMATDSTMGVMPVNSMLVDIHGGKGGFPSSGGAPNVAVSSVSQQLPNENMSGRDTGARVSRASAVLAQAWKDDVDVGNLSGSLFECFGERMFIFTPKPELSFFL